MWEAKMSYNADFSEIQSYGIEEYGQLDYRPTLLPKEPHDIQIDADTIYFFVYVCSKYHQDLIEVAT